jgi:tetratricopeptide (TPR) repeat protein
MPNSEDSTAGSLHGAGYNRERAMLNTEGRNRRAAGVRRGVVGAGAVVVVVASLARLGGGVGGRPPAPAAAAVQEPAAVREPFSRQAAQAIGRGQRAQAEEMARQRGPADPDAAAVLARLAIDRGNYEEAESVLRPAAMAQPRGEAALELGLLLAARGRRAEARALLEGLTAVEGEADGVASLRAGVAARALGLAHDANSFLMEAAAAAPSDPAVYVARGELFLERHDRAEAVNLFKEALERDARWAPAHLGLARALASQNPAAALAAGARAGDIDGGLADVHVFFAEAALDADRRADARQAIGRALAINPRHPGAHALAAALAHVEGSTAEAEKAVADALSVNPTYGDAYRVPAAQLASSGRFEAAVPLARRAADLEPWNPRTLGDLGLHLLRVGEEGEARQVLERAFEADAFDVVTFNLLQLLDTLDTFTTVPVGNARLRMDPVESPVLEPYARSIVEQAMARYATTYGLEPRGPVLVEIFPKHDDFAVRTLGIPGLLGALGACFGRVVTQDSPRARPPNTFNWQATLWHELAHVFTLQLSDYRVPRWLSEGISVYEEGRVRPEWAHDSEMAFLEVYTQGRAPKLSDFNAAFTRPDLVSAAYFQASLVVQLLVDRHGEGVLRKLVSAFASGASAEDALRAATGAGLADLQSAFDELAQKRYGAAAKAFAVPDGFAIPKPATREALVELAKRHDGSFRAQMAVGQALAEAGSHVEALAAFERAAALVPFARGAASPRARMAVVALKQGDEARARRELEAVVRQDHDNVDAARQLASLLDKADKEAVGTAGGAGATDELRVLALERIVTADPFDAAAHTALGRIALGRRDAALSVREFQAALAARPPDPVSARCDLAEAYLLAGRRDEARRELLAALETAPTYERAQDLLLRASEGK